MPSQITEYKCPACTGPLHFAGSSGKLECDYCGQSFDAAEIEALYAKEDAAAQKSFADQEANAASEDRETAWDTSGLSDQWDEDAEGLRSFQCPSCGAELICDETTVATSCPYCGNNTIIPGQFGGALKPEYMIPFKLDKNAAVAALKAHCKGKLFLPRAFSSGHHLNEVKGIYVPFWLFDADADADCRFHATRSHTYTDGEYEVIETEHFDVRRSGSMRFERIPADGSKKMPDDYMDSIEPFDYTGLKPFSTAYLPGYLADKYDVSAEENMERADRRCRSTAIEAMRRDVLGYEAVTPISSEVYLRRGKVHYALMPVWTLRTRWQDRDYLFMMNGQTGKLVGDLPVSAGRFWGVTAALTVLLGLLFFWTGVGRMIASAFLG